MASWEDRGPYRSWGGCVGLLVWGLATGWCLEGVLLAALPRKAGLAGRPLARLTFGSLRAATTDMSQKAESGGLPGVGDSGSRRGQERLVQLPVSFVMRAGVLWRRTPPAHSRQVPSGFGVGEGPRAALGALGFLLSERNPWRLRVPPPAFHPSLLSPGFKGATGLLGRKARPFSLPCSPWRRGWNQEPPWSRGSFLFCLQGGSREGAGVWGPCRAVRGAGIPAHHDGVGVGLPGRVPTQRH